MLFYSFINIILYAMKLNASAHKNIFLLTCLGLVILVFVAAATSAGDEATHRSYYKQYKDANALFEDRNFAESYEVYKRLAEVYGDAYILELKMTVCAMNLDLWAAAVNHSRRVLELYPLLAKDKDFMEALSYCLRELGEAEASARIEDYLYDFALEQT